MASVGTVLSCTALLLLGCCLSEAGIELLIKAAGIIFDLQRSLLDFLLAPPSPYSCSRPWSHHRPPRSEFYHFLRPVLWIRHRQ